MIKRCCLAFVSLSIVIAQCTYAFPNNHILASSELTLTDADIDEFKLNMGLSQAQIEASGQLDLNNIFESGYIAGSQFVDSRFYIDPTVGRVFLAQEKIFQFASLPRVLPPAFSVVVNPIKQYIQTYREKVFFKAPALYKLSFDQLAEKITRAAFCFKVDPKMETAKLQQETKFDRTAYSINGVGMSQLVTPGIGEVYDQIGGRRGMAPLENVQFFNQAIDCYLGKTNGLEEVLWKKGIPKGLSALSVQNVDAIKNLIMNDFDLDLIFGQIVLKVNLIIAKSQSANMRANYYTAMLNYNGSQTKVQYANSVLRIYDEISKNTAVPPSVSL